MQKSIHLLLLLVSFLGVLMLLYVMRNGPMIGNDTIIYLSAAENIAQGKGWLCFEHGSLKLMTQWPPLYSIFLSVFLILGFDFAGAVFNLNLITFVLNIYLFGFLIFRLTASKNFAFAGSLFFLSTPQMLKLHAFGWSEPLFFNFVLLGFILISFFQDQKQIKYLILSAVCVALSVLTRYVGVSFIAGICLFVFLFSSKSFLKNVKNTFIYGLISGLPLLALLLFNKYNTGLTTNREKVFHGVPIDKLKSAIWTISDWFIEHGVLPLMIQKILLFGFGLVIFVLFLRFFNHLFKQKDFEQSNKIFPILFSLAFYLILLGYAFFFYTAGTPLDYRILSPVYVTLILCLTFFVSYESRSIHTALKKLVQSSLIFLVFFQFFRGLGWTFQAHEYAYDSQNRQWKTSQTLQYLDDLSQTHVIYSNASKLIFYWTGAYTRQVPKVFEPATGNENPFLEKEIQMIQKKLSEKEGIIVFFDAFLDESDYLADPKHLKAVFPLKLERQFSDAKVYRYDSK